jgi:hypothetical protein
LWETDIPLTSIPHGPIRANFPTIWWNPHLRFNKQSVGEFGLDVGSADHDHWRSWCPCWVFGSTFSSLLCFLDVSRSRRVIIVFLLWIKTVKDAAMKIAYVQRTLADQFTLGLGSTFSSQLDFTVLQTSLV